MGQIQKTQLHIGGLERDDQGTQIEGFCGRIGYALFLKAGLWGIRCGLKLAKDRDQKGVILESDSENALDLIEWRNRKSPGHDNH